MKQVFDFALRCPLLRHILRRIQDYAFLKEKYAFQRPFKNHVLMMHYMFCNHSRTAVLLAFGGEGRVGNEYFTLCAPC